MRSAPDRRRRRRGHATRLILAWVVGACLLGPGALGADQSRFLRWEAASTPALELRDLAGRPQALADYRGRVVVVNFWATWCTYCKDEVASMTRLREQLAGRPLEILLVNYGESSAKVRAYARQLPAEVRVLLDPGQEAARAWQVRVIPSSFVVDTEGAIRYRAIGNLDWTSEEAVRTVRALLP